ncbi:MAG TPA: glutamine-hydrolyzing GMP synthase [Bacillota bacterium]|nr:glutamine-hydrolyzing GMP synthase [Bacillota bacterium]
MVRETIIIMDFGGGHSQLIARRVREARVYCEILPHDTSAARIKTKNPKGIILSGNLHDIGRGNTPRIDGDIFSLGIGILGISYGGHLIVSHFDGKLSSLPQATDNNIDTALVTDSLLFSDISAESQCQINCTATIGVVPAEFRAIAHTGNQSIVGVEDGDKKVYGLMFHPQALHTSCGKDLLKNFLYKVCECSGDWDMTDFAEESIKRLRDYIGDKKVLCALSGGVDSSVAALMVHKAVGKQLVCIFVDHGLLRKDEGDQVEEIFGKQFDLNLIRVNAQDRFLSRLKGVSDPETKRKIIGQEFIRVFEEEARKIGRVDYLVQGTIYPDVIESGVGGSSVIKSHHNVGGLPDNVDFKEIIEPLRDLLKDEVRLVGEVLGIPKDLVWRQPFPGPGLAIRIIGDITPEKLEILREADAIYRHEIANAGLDKVIWQYFTVLTGMRSVGVSQDQRTYDYTVALRGVTSIDGMTADWARIPFEVLDRISNRITSEVKRVNRVVYDITGKPPGTIEWE